MIFFLLFFIFLLSKSKKDVAIYVNITNDISSIENFNVEVYGILTDSSSIMKAKRNFEFNIGGNSKCAFDYKKNSAIFKFKAKDIYKFKVDEQKYFLLN